MCSSSTSKPAATSVRAVSTYAAVIRVRSCSEADRIICIDSGLGIRLALSAWTPLERPLATGPAWPTWPAIVGAGLVDRLGQPGQPVPVSGPDDDLLAVGAALRARRPGRRPWSARRRPRATARW